MELTRKPRNQRSKRAFEERNPKIFENIKKALLIKSNTCSKVVYSVLQDFNVLKKPHSMIFSKKNNAIFPFIDRTSLEFICSKNDCSLFAIGSHSKKRPHTLVLGRCFDFQVLDMIELSINTSTYKSITSFSQKRRSIQLDTKPCFLFLGKNFEENSDCILFKSILLDFFYGKNIEIINLAGLDHVIVVTSYNPNIVHFRHFSIEFQDFENNIPKIKLIEAGPLLDFKIGKIYSADKELQVAARKTRINKPISIESTKSNKKKYNKNKKRGPLGNTLGILHVPPQDLNKLSTTKKGLKGASSEKSKKQKIN